MDNNIVIWPIIVLAISTIVFVRSKIAIVDHFTVYNKTYPKCFIELYRRHRKLWWLERIMITSIFVSILFFFASLYELIITFIKLP